MANHFLTIAERLKCGLTRAVAIVGPVGIDKSTLAIGLAQHCGTPLLCFNGEPGISRDDMMNIYKEKPEYEDVFHFNVEYLFEAAKSGYIVLIDELNYISPVALHTINYLLSECDYCSFKGVPFKRHPNFALIVTMNSKVARELPDSMKSRFINIEV